MPRVVFFLHFLIFFVNCLFFLQFFFLLPLLSPAFHDSLSTTSAKLTNFAACFRRVFIAMPPVAVDVMTLPVGVLQPPTQVHQWLRLVTCKEPFKFQTFAPLCSVFFIYLRALVAFPLSTSVTDTADIFRWTALNAQLCRFERRSKYHLHLSGKT